LIGALVEESLDNYYKYDKINRNNNLLTVLVAGTDIAFP